MKGGAWLAGILPEVVPPAPPAPRVLELERRGPRNIAEQLEQLERELAQLLTACAPSTWAAHRRSVARVLRAARREIRAGSRS